MKYQKKIGVVIPTLNEAESLKYLLPMIPKYVDEIIIVDGYSKDDTVNIAKNFGCKVYYDKIGKGSALIRGGNNSTADYIIMMDADLSHRPLEMELLIGGLKIGYDICMGSRFIMGGGSDDITFIRKAGNKFFVLLVNILYNAKYTDLCYGYRAFTKECFKSLKLRSKGFSIETEISIKARKKNMKILEVPSYEKKRSAGVSNLRTFSDGWKILKVILREVTEK